MSAHFHASLKPETVTNCSIGTPPARQSWMAAAVALPGMLWREIQLRRATRRLHGMDDRMLGDIGIGRADIDTAVRHGRRYPVPYL
jgi:uncharacterized protein YjiS (DUF1127 family)